MFLVTVGHLKSFFPTIVLKLMYLLSSPVAVYLSHALSKGQNGPSIDCNALAPSTGFTYELCAGIIDKEKPVADIATEELLEECGYQVNADCLEEITRCRLAI